MSFKRVAKSVFFWTGMMGIFLLMLSLFGLLFLETKFNIEKIAILSVFWGTSFGIIINLSEKAVNSLSFSFGLALGILCAGISILIISFTGVVYIDYILWSLLFLTAIFCSSFLISQKHKIAVVFGVVLGFMISFFLIASFFKDLDFGFIMTFAFSNVIIISCVLAVVAILAFRFLFWLFKKIVTSNKIFYIRKIW